MLALAPVITHTRCALALPAFFQGSREFCAPAPFQLVPKLHLRLVRLPRRLFQLIQLLNDLRQRPVFVRGAGVEVAARGNIKIVLRDFVGTDDAAEFLDFLPRQKRLRGLNEHSLVAGKNRAKKAEGLLLEMQMDLKNLKERLQVELTELGE